MEPVNLAGYSTLGTIIGLSLGLHYRIYGSPHKPLIKPTKKISIVIPTLNEERYISGCLKDLHNQELIKQYPEDVEILLVDSHSEDSTVEIARDQVDRVIYAPRGLLTARNIGAREASNPIIAFVDADCRYPKTWLGDMSYHFQTNPRCGIVAGPHLLLPEGNMFHRLFWNVFIVPSLVNRRWNSGGNTAVLKQAYWQVGGLDENVNQLNIYEVFPKAELELGNKIVNAGYEYIFEWAAACYHYPRRITDPKFIAQIGVIRQ